MLVICNHTETCTRPDKDGCPHSKPHEPKELCTTVPMSCNAGSDGTVLCEETIDLGSVREESLRMSIDFKIRRVVDHLHEIANSLEVFNEKGLNIINNNLDTIADRVTYAAMEDK